MLSGLALCVSESAGYMEHVTLAPQLRDLMEQQMHRNPHPMDDFHFPALHQQPLQLLINSPSRQRPNHSIDAILGIQRGGTSEEKQTPNPMVNMNRHHRLSSTSPTVSPCMSPPENHLESTGQESDFSEEGCKPHTEG